MLNAFLQKYIKSFIYATIFRLFFMFYNIFVCFCQFLSSGGWGWWTFFLIVEGRWEGRGDYRTSSTPMRVYFAVFPTPPGRANLPCGRFAPPGRGGAIITSPLRGLEGSGSGCFRFAGLVGGGGGSGFVGLVDGMVDGFFFDCRWALGGRGIIGRLRRPCGCILPFPPRLPVGQICPAGNLRRRSWWGYNYIAPFGA